MAEETVVDRALAAAANAAREVLEDELGDDAAAVLLFAVSSPAVEPNAASLSAAFGGMPDQLIGAVLAQLGGLMAGAAIENARELGVTIIEVPHPPSNN